MRGAILFVLSLAALTLNISKEPIPYDEGFILSGASRILDAQRPFRDFYTGYPPGQFYAVALLFKLFGTEILVARLYDSALRASLAVTAYLIARRLGSEASALLAWFVLTLWLSHIGFFCYPVIPALVLISAASLLIVATDGRRTVSLIVVVMSGFFRLDLAIAAWGALFAFHLVSRTNVKSFLLQSAAFSVAAVAIIVTIFPATEVWKMVCYFPFIVLPSYRKLPLPAFSLDLSIVGLYFPVFVFILASARLLLPPSIKDGRERSVIFYLLFQGASFLIPALSRSDLPHMIPPYVASTALLGYICSPGCRSWNLRSAAVSVIAIALAILNTIHPIREYLKRPTNVRFDHEIARARNTGLTPGYVDALHYVAALTKEHEPVFVSLERHDKLALNDALFNFLAARPNPTRFVSFEPGIVTSDWAQREIIRDLEAAQVKVVVIARFRLQDEPNRSAQGSGVVVLDEHIRKNYVEAARFSRHTVLVQRPTRTGAERVISPQPDDATTPHTVRLSGGLRFVTWGLRSARPTGDTADSHNGWYINRGQVTAASAYCGVLNCDGGFCVGGEGGDFDSCTGDPGIAADMCRAV